MQPQPKLTPKCAWLGFKPKSQKAKAKPSQSLRDPANSKQMVNKQFKRLYYLALCEEQHTGFRRVPGHLGGPYNEVLTSYKAFGTPVAGYAPNIVISHLFPNMLTLCDFFSHPSILIAG
ncbi:hypothetical protein DFH09DRAFT_1110039 [Mycena vulgaris]|nr:hypothetical protein DFH09DRAFT_1110039 [Mycena vulgaris]